MANYTDRQKGQDEGEQLQDTLLASFVIGVVILAIWFSVFLIYVNRL